MSILAQGETLNKYKGRRKFKIQILGLENMYRVISVFILCKMKYAVKKYKSIVSFYAIICDVFFYLSLFILHLLIVCIMFLCTAVT